MNVVQRGLNPFAPFLVCFILFDLHKNIQSMQTNIPMTQKEQQQVRKFISPLKKTNLPNRRILRLQNYQQILKSKKTKR
jgi:hypothetical protein